MEIGLNVGTHAFKDTIYQASDECATLGMGGQAKVIGSEDRLITHLIQFAALVGLRLLITGHSHPSGLKIFTQLTHKRQFGTRGKCTAAIVL